MTRSTIKVTVNLSVSHGDEVDLNEVAANMDYHFSSNTDGAKVVDDEIVEIEIDDPTSIL